MVEAQLKSVRKYGMFVHEMRCQCTDNQLKATKFTKVKIKYTDEGRRKCCWFMLAISIICPFVMVIALWFLLSSGILSSLPPVVIWIVLIVMFLAALSFNIAEVVSILLCAHKSYFDRRHTALEVLFNCYSCGHEVYKTYECFIHSSRGKNLQRYSRNKTYNPWGRYTAEKVTKTLVKKPSAMITFEAVEREFNVMSGDQKNNFTTSWAWINDLMSHLD
ncbi:hypothetical protein niasHS_001129 [Heterodera schachtii]|uniref:Uncharacterized protein n=1 Tax=Heterodera schachtii TaxID=97005 RepID=A0ABD2KC82_HETSC